MVKSQTTSPFTDLNFFGSAMSTRCLLRTLLPTPRRDAQPSAPRDSDVGLLDPKPLFSLRRHIGHGVRRARERSEFQFPLSYFAAPFYELDEVL